MGADNAIILTGQIGGQQVKLTGILGSVPPSHNNILAGLVFLGFLIQTLSLSLWLLEFFPKHWEKDGKMAQVSNMGWEKEEPKIVHGIRETIYVILLISSFIIVFSFIRELHISTKFPIKLPTNGAVINHAIFATTLLTFGLYIFKNYLINRFYFVFIHSPISFIIKNFKIKRNMTKAGEMAALLKQTKPSDLTSI